MATIYRNGVLSSPTAEAGEPQGLLQWPSDTSFSGPVGGTLDDISLVPDLQMDTPVLWQAYGPSLGLPEMDSSGRVVAPGGRSAQAGLFSSPWLLIGGLAIVFLALRR